MSYREALKEARTALGLINGRITDEVGGTLEGIRSGIAEMHADISNKFADAEARDASNRELLLEIRGQLRSALSAAKSVSALTSRVYKIEQKLGLTGSGNGTPSPAE